MRKIEPGSVFRTIGAALSLWMCAVPAHAHGEEGMAALIFLAAYALIFFGFLLVVLFLGKIRYSRAITTLCVYVACATIAFILPLFYDQIYGDLNSAQFVLVMSGIPSLAGWIGALAWLFWRKRVGLQKAV